MPIDLYHLGRRIAAARERLDMTQDELAKRVGLTQATVARLEKARKKRPELQTVVAIAEALKVSLPALLYDDHKQSDT